MNTRHHIHPEATVNTASPGSHQLCDKIDADHEWEGSQREKLAGGEHAHQEIVRAFEFDIHDCWLSEMNR